MCSLWCCLQKHKGLQKAGLAQSSGIRSFYHPSLAMCSFLARPSGNTGFVSHAGPDPSPGNLNWGALLLTLRFACASEWSKKVPQLAMDRKFDRLGYNFDVLFVPFYSKVQ